MKITRTEITDKNKRTMALPDHFGTAMLLFESTVYNFARGLNKTYAGGFWTYYELSNGGFYMVPDITTPVHVKWNDNNYEGTMSADAFGIVVCLFALSHLSFWLERRQGDRHFAARTRIAE